MHIKFNFKPSYYLLGILSLASLLSLTLIVFMPISTGLKALLLMLVLLSAAFYIAKDALYLFAGSWVTLEIDSQDQMRLSASNGQQYLVSVLPESLVASYLIVLQLKVEQQFWRKSLILLPDSANPEDLRRLRVWLKWASHKADESEMEEGDTH